MTPSSFQLLSILADGQYHSGEGLGEVLAISRAAVWKQIQQLQELGVEIQSVKGKGYCVPGGMSLLNKQVIANGLGGAAEKLLKDLLVEPVLESTNQFLLEKSRAGESIHGVVCLAEKQTAGRGRRGRSWQSPFACNLYCSLGWRIENGVNAIEGLSLAVGVALSEALSRLGVGGVQLKWPNDLLFDEKKLGGILLEISGDASGECDLVLGFGLNVHMPETAASNIDQAWTDMASICGADELPDRNEIAAKVMTQILLLMGSYESHGFAPYKTRWEKLNAHHNKQVKLFAGSKETVGVVQGVSKAGALLLNVDGSVQEFIGGEISVRPVL